MNIFERFRNGETIDICDPQYVEEANSEMRRCRHLCCKIDQLDPNDQEEIMDLERELIADQQENCFITLPFQIDVARCLHLGKNVFVNTGLSMMSIGSVTIGDGTIIGSGAVVTKDIPAHAIAVGNPVRVIRTVA